MILSGSRGRLGFLAPFLPLGFLDELVPSLSHCTLGSSVYIDFCAKKRGGGGGGARYFPLPWSYPLPVPPYLIEFSGIPLWLPSIHWVVILHLSTG